MDLQNQALMYGVSLFPNLKINQVMVNVVENALVCYYYCEEGVHQVVLSPDKMKQWVDSHKVIIIEADDKAMDYAEFSEVITEQVLQEDQS